MKGVVFVFIHHLECDDVDDIRDSCELKMPLSRFSDCDSRLCQSWVHVQLRSAILWSVIRLSCGLQHSESLYLECCGEAPGWYLAVLMSAASYVLDKYSQQGWSFLGRHVDYAFDTGPQHVGSIRNDKQRTSR